MLRGSQPYQRTNFPNDRMAELAEQVTILFVVYACILEEMRGPLNFSIQNYASGHAKFYQLSSHQSGTGSCSVSCSCLGLSSMLVLMQSYWLRLDKNPLPNIKRPLSGRLFAKHFAGFLVRPRAQYGRHCCLDWWDHRLGRPVEGRPNSANSGLSGSGFRSL